MSLDVFLTRYAGGAEVPLDPAAVRAVVDPLASERDPEHLFVRVETRDGSADVYGCGEPFDSLMVDLDGGDEVRGFVLDLARATGAVLGLTDPPVAVPDEALLADLPADLRAGAVVVGTVEELSQFLRS
ncbi:hypothetical protein AB2L28_03765 [Kineococcus sp. TBRC 1896]|uniref:Immunity protein 10 of polymorphic toxin system n=1 Tax=Kineococcus mangrovi TaxID=1660183 RepID=A0ABV4HY51_9ACTN